MESSQFSNHRVSGGSRETQCPAVSFLFPRLRNSHFSRLCTICAGQIYVDSSHTRQGFQTGLANLLAPDKWGAQISPGNKKLVFTRSFSGTNEVWISGVDGSNLLKLTSLDGPHAGSPRWSPDGKWIALAVDAGVQGRVFVVSAKGGPSREIAPDGNSQHLVPNWSRDSRWIYFASDQSGDWQVWKAPLDGGKPVQITHLGGFAASESPDGAYGYY